MLVIDENLQIPLRELNFSFSRSGGPGGQNVNKVNTKATLTWSVAASESLPADVRARFEAKFSRRINKDGVLIVTSQRYRDSGRNVADCLAKLREMVLAVVEPPKPRRTTRPTKASREKRLDEKKRTSRKKEMRRRPVDD